MLKDIHAFGPFLYSLVACRAQLGIKEGTKSIDCWISFLLASFHQKAHVEINDLEQRQSEM